MKVNAYAVKEPKGKLEKIALELPKLGDEQVDVKVDYCGICHSDISMMNNDWGLSEYPLIPGHEAVGEVVAVGSQVKNVKVGDRVGLGWISGSCMHCEQCMDGDHNLCTSLEQTIVGRHGGFADHVRGHWSWTVPLPKEIDMSKAGPLLCAGITVFNPIVLSGVKPTDTVGVIGIGGLGHLALKFLKAWGCEVIAFSSNPDKKEQILEMGATKVINSRDPKELESIKGKLNFILNTTNVPLDWGSYIEILAPKGKLHTVGIIPDDMEVSSGALIFGEKSVGGSLIGSPALIKKMLNFCVRHNIYPTTEEFKMEDVNEAVEHLEQGKARYRVVLKN